MNRLTKLAKKLNSVSIALELAKYGLSSANKNNPFWTKSEAMTTLNNLRNIERKLLKIKKLEYSLI